MQKIEFFFPQDKSKIENLIKKYFTNLLYIDGLAWKGAAYQRIKFDDVKNLKFKKVFVDSDFLIFQNL